MSIFLYKHYLSTAIPKQSTIFFLSIADVFFWRRINTLLVIAEKLFSNRNSNLGHSVSTIKGEKVSAKFLTASSVNIYANNLLVCCFFDNGWLNLRCTTSAKQQHQPTLMRPSSFKFRCRRLSKLFAFFSTVEITLNLFVSLFDKEPERVG